MKGNRTVPLITIISLCGLLLGCTTQYITDVSFVKDAVLSKYQKIAISNIHEGSGTSERTADIVRTSISSKMKNAGFVIEDNNNDADAVLDIKILEYGETRRYSSGTSDWYIPGTYDKQGRWKPGYTIPGMKGDYYDSGDVRINLKLSDVNTHRLIWESTAYGSGVPSAIVNSVSDELIDCMKLTLNGQNCDRLMRK